MHIQGVRPNQRGWVKWEIFALLADGFVWQALYFEDMVFRGSVLVVVLW